MGINTRRRPDFNLLDVIAAGACGRFFPPIDKLIPRPERIASESLSRLDDALSWMNISLSIALD